MSKKQNYLYTPWSDWLFIIAPPFICLAIVFVCAPYFSLHHEVEPFHWLILVMMVDVSHVYSTIYRTYLDPDMRQNHKLLLYGIPLVVWVAGIIMYLFGDLMFWRIMAYLAVFHFVRQQYGFFKLYGRTEVLTPFRKTVSTLMIYAATLYPVLIWHVSGAKNFTWFVQNDFLLTERRELIPYITLAYGLIWLIYLYQEFQAFLTTKFVNIPKNMILLGTALSWYFGIVYYNSDLIFTFLNVVSHGVPYMALVWMYGHKRMAQKTFQFSEIQTLVFSTKGIIAFVLILLGLAYLEETLWDSLVWHDHPEYFSFHWIWGTELGTTLKLFLVPLLAVPQVTHYVLDGFIWKLRTDKSALSAL